MAMGLAKGEGIGLQDLQTAIPPSRFNEMHAHALASSREQLMMPPLSAQLCSAQITESRAEASALMARQPRLETRDTPAAASQLPPVLGGDGGVYIKWALVLQEQLAHVQGERAGLAEQVAGLKLENEQLRQALEAGNTAGTAASATPGAAALALPGASGADAASAEAGESAEAQAQSTSDRTRTRSAALEPALPAAKQAAPAPSSGVATRSSGVGLAREGSAGAPPAAAAFAPPQPGVVSEAAALLGTTPAPAGAPAAAAGAGGAAASLGASSGGGGRKRPLSEEAPASPFSSPNLRFLAGFLDAPGLPPTGGALLPAAVWGHAERIGAEEGKGGPAKLQRGASTAKTLGSFDRLQPGR